MKNMKKCMLFMAFIMIFGINSSHWVFGKESADEIMQKLDYNQAPDSVTCHVTMSIHHLDREDVKEMEMYGTGQTRFYGIFLSPQRDKGTSALRLDDNLWVYFPSAERTIKISGHMLSQSFMGSDFSYEDTSERLKLREKYEPTLIGEEKMGNTEAYVLSLKAKKADATYFTRKIWINKTNFAQLRQEMYAKSGKLLKIMTIEETKLIGKRYYATKIRMVDKIKKDSYTTMTLDNVILDQAISESIFTQRTLEKKR